VGLIDQGKEALNPAEKIFFPGYLTFQRLDFLG
jgi:hypothetical protein